MFRLAEIGNPPGPITKLKFTGEGVLVGALGIICFLSTGLGGPHPPLTLSPPILETKNCGPTGL